MTLNLQAALPQDLAQKVEELAAQRGLSASDFAVLLAGLWTLPQMLLSEDAAVRDLSSELMLHCQQQAVRMERVSGKSLDLLPDPFASKPTLEEIQEELKNWRTPQSLSELKPRVSPPPGMTIHDMLPREPWPGNETDQELLAALKAMD